MPRNSQSKNRERDYAFSEFPQDESSWYVRWLGPLFKSGTRSTTPMIQVYLERLQLKPEQVRDRKLVHSHLSNPHQPDPGDCRVAKVSAATLPALWIGRVFHKGRPIGSMKLATGTFELDDRVNESRMVTVADEGMPTPSWWDDTLNYRVINRSEYRVPELQTNCLVLTQSVNKRRIDVVIPCTEVFRCLYARESKIIREMLAAPWQDALERIVDTKRTGRIDESTWQVVLRKGMSEKFPEYAANLILNPDGMRAANHIHGAIPMDAKTWHLAAPLPFVMKRFRLRGRVLVLRREKSFTKFLCTEILGCSYPLQGINIRYILEADARQGDKKTKAAGKPPYSKVYADILDEEEPIPNTSEEDPSAESLSLYHDAEGSGWLDAVQKYKSDKAVSKVYQRPRDDADGPRRDRTSAGEAFSGRSSSAPGQFTSAPEYTKKLADRFKDVLAMMERLREQGKIKSWWLIKPSEQKYAAYQDAVAVWKLSSMHFNHQFGENTYRPWAVIKGPPTRARTLIVIEIRLKKARLIWFDLEPKPIESRDHRAPKESRGHRALVLRVDAGQDDIERIIHYVRSLSVRTLGRWYLDDESKNVVVPGALKIVRWKHRHAQKRLNEVSALNALLKLAES